MNEQLKSRIEALNKKGANLSLKQIADKYSLEANGFRIAPLGTENEIEMFLRGYAIAEMHNKKLDALKIVRRLRVLEYVGSQEWVDSMITNRQIKGTRVISSGSIREAFLGDTNEIMLEAEIEQINDKRKQALDKSSSLMLEGKATDNIWAMEDGPESHPIGIRLDCGDSGVVYLSRSQADDLTTMLVNKFGCIIQLP
jgi:hypothetical protein